MSAFPLSLRAVDLGINEIKARAIEEAERRGKIATRGTLNTLSVAAFSTAHGATGILEGEEQWKYVGNGRGPGKMPPVMNIQRWIDATGSDLNAWAVAKGIAKRGSKDWRNNAPNVFLSAIDDFENGGGLDRLEETAGQEMEDAIVDSVRLNLTARR